MRLPAILFFATVACAPSEEFVATASSAGLSSPTLSIGVAASAASTVYVIPVRFDEEGAITWSGSALASAAIEEGVATVTLPARAPGRHLDPADRRAPIHYVVYARATDDDGSPEEYVGVGQESVVYYPVKGDGLARGWYVASTDASGEVDYASTDHGISVSDGMNPAKEVAMSGTVGDLGSDEGALYRMAFIGDEGMVPGWMVDVTAEWTYTFSDLPPVAATETMGFATRTVTPTVWIDGDADGLVDDEEPIVGSVCFGADPVVAIYVDKPYNPPEAWAISSASFGTAWGLYAMTASGPSPIAGASSTSFAANFDCAMAVAGEDGGGKESEESGD
jgi:hypothetical protein